MSDIQLRELRARRIGMVLQNFGLLPVRSARENLIPPLEIQKIPLNRRFDLAEAELERVGLARAFAADPFLS